jgi:hypothetical protein
MFRHVLNSSICPQARELQKRVHGFTSVWCLTLSNVRRQARGGTCPFGSVPRDPAGNCRKQTTTADPFHPFTESYSYWI